MKENITKFDLEQAFKALDEIEIPKVNGLKPNRINIKESMKKVDKTSALLEDYYDLNDSNDVDEAIDEREDEIAAAKLAKIEKIVDLDAESVDDIQPSYVGKTIIQCPQCLTLFYKDPADIVPSEDDPAIVNVEEVCQHCGNDTGYTIIGKVAEEEVPASEAAEEPVEETPAEEPEEEPVAEENTEEELAEEELPDLDIPEEGEEEEEEVKESLELKESSVVTDHIDLKDGGSLDCRGDKDGSWSVIKTFAPEENGISKVDFEKKYSDEESARAAWDKLAKELNEEACIPTDLEEAVDTKQIDHAQVMANAFIDYLKNQLKIDKEALEKAKKAGAGEAVYNAIQRRIDASEEDLKKALPEAVKDEVESDNLPAANEVPVEEAKEEKKEEVKEELTEGTGRKKIEKKYNTWTEIMWDLTGGRNYVAPSGSIGISSGKYPVQATYNNKEDNIVVQAKTPEELQPAIEIAKKWNKDFEGPVKQKYGDKYELIIKTTEADFEDGIFEESLKENKEGLRDCIRIKSNDPKDLEPVIEFAKERKRDYAGPRKVENSDYYEVIIKFTAEDVADFKRVFTNESLKAESLKEALHKFPELGIDEIDNFFKVCDKIGLKTLADVQRFKEENCANGEDLLKALNDYAINELGPDFKVEEDVKEPLKEDDISDAEFEELLDSKEFKQPISGTEVDKYLVDDEKPVEVKKEATEEEKPVEENLDELEDFDEALFNEHINKYLKEVYSNVNSFETTNCEVNEGKLIVEGKVEFTSGKTKNVSFTFNKTNNGLLEGISNEINKDIKFQLSYKVESVNNAKTLITEALKYDGTLQGNKISGQTK